MERASFDELEDEVDPRAFDDDVVELGEVLVGAEGEVEPAFRLDARAAVEILLEGV